MATKTKTATAGKGPTLMTRQNIADACAEWARKRRPREVGNGKLGVKLVVSCGQVSHAEVFDKQ